jgi:hypothetical protein
MYANNLGTIRALNIEDTNIWNIGAAHPNT